VSREKRMTRIRDIWAKEVDVHAAELAKASAAEQVAKQALAAAQRARTEADKERQIRITRATRAEEWGEMAAWGSTLAKREDVAQWAAERAATATAEARAKWLASKSKVGRIENLLERLRAAKRKVEERASQKLDDEFASRFASARNAGD
jgi:flagellar export protein FliJ